VLGERDVLPRRTAAGATATTIHSCVPPFPADAPGQRRVSGDLASRRWVEQLHPDHPRHVDAAARLHDVLQRAAAHELHRRRGQLKALSGPELDDVAQQCADDAMMKILARTDDFQGLSRFPTWAYKFVIFEVSSKVARHAWQRHPPSLEEPTWDRLPDTLTPKAGDQAERREQLAPSTPSLARPPGSR
jgi:RNA polymerase sigma-70 factor (ECF subfamily)